MDADSIVSKTIPYADGSTDLEGFAVYPKAGKHPTVILCHAWRGRDPFICKKAERLARTGYTAFALDLYGKGILGQSKEENSALKQPFLEDRDLLRRRLLLSYEAACALPQVDRSRIAVLGFGFGGLAALDLARSGVNLQGAISVYGHFEPPLGLPKKPIQAKILILHGYEDPIAKQTDLRAFEKEMNEEKVDWQVHLYSQTLHAFANPDAKDPASGLLYNPLSEKRAWRSIDDFLQEILHY